jgi:hypothetical protein
MAFNGSDLITHPFNTTFSPYTNLFGMAFFAIPVVFIGAALFLKTRDAPLTSAYFIITGVFLLAGSVSFSDWGASLIFGLLTAAGIGVLAYGVLYGGNKG